MSLEQRNHNPKVTGSSPVSGIAGKWEFAGGLHLRWRIVGAGESVSESHERSENEPRISPDASLSEAAQLEGIVREYADHQSVRCGWPAGYKQWVDGDCACGLTVALREAGLPVEWAGGPPE